MPMVMEAKTKGYKIWGIFDLTSFMGDDIFETFYSLIE